MANGLRANQGAEAIRKDIADMLKKSPKSFAEEWAIHDFEGFGDYRVSESEDIEEIAAMAAQIEEHGEAYLAALALSSNRAEADALMEEYCGEFNSDEEFTRQLLEDTDSLPKDLPLFIHIDWSWTAKEIMMDYAEHHGHYFRQPSSQSPKKLLLWIGVLPTSVVCNPGHDFNPKS